VVNKLKDESFAREHSNNRAPLAMIAAASVIVENIIRPDKGSSIKRYFHGITMIIPHVMDCTDPFYHSISGQKLLLVDWKKMLGVDVVCPKCKQCHLKNDRTNFSKNKVLFPIFGLDGPPSWAMVMSMQCPSCKIRFSANDSTILCRLPAYASSFYPVDTRYALANKNCHLSRSATDIFDSILPTYGNADLCSRLLYKAINRAYLERAASYFSHVAECRGSKVTSMVNATDQDTMQDTQPFLDKDGVYIRAYPPLGEIIRDLYNEASHNSNNHWGISDHDRHTREIQGVKCSVVMAQDHTHEVTKNYIQKKQLGMDALWDVATETGEIACAVLVPSTKTSDFSHAAKQLSMRPSFNPQAMYSDTWPCKSDFWSKLLGHEVKGRLGLFHYIQRITRTLRKRHIDYHQSIRHLLDCLYYYNQDDYERLLIALKNGTLSASGTKYTDDEIDEMKNTKLFRRRYGKYLRKEIRQPNVMISRLEDWFNRYKCSSSDEQLRPARGRLDPTTQQPLFTPETREAWSNCKDKAAHLQDPLPLSEMYFVIPPNPNSTHGLYEYLSLRGESSLESFHNLLAHFANGGMRNSLADNLNLTGTARYNLTIRHKLRIGNSMSLEQRRKMPGAWETVVPYFNHSELSWINSLAEEAGCSENLPFPYVEELPEDNGERFFSKYLEWKQLVKPSCDENDICMCSACMNGQGNGIHMDKESTSNSQHDIAETMDASDNRNNTTTNTTMNATMNATMNIPMHDFLNTSTINYNSQYINNGIYPPVPFYMPVPIQTGWFIPPVTMAPVCCCGPYKQYLIKGNRRGRPPHDWNCHKRK
jgi:hypothetical protein